MNLTSEQKQLKDNLKKDITGRWVWEIQDGPGKGQMGFFQIQETDKNVKERSAVLLYRIQTNCWKRRKSKYKSCNS